MRFYDVGGHAHPFFYWAEPDVFPADFFGLVRRSTRPRNPPKYSIEHGRMPGHIIWDNLWSTEMTDVLKACHATGYGTYGVCVTRKGQPVEGYVGIYVFGQGGHLDVKRSKAEFYPSGSIRSYSAIHMVESEWDGSDVFTIPEMGVGIFVVERVARELLKLKLKNVAIVPNDECHLP